MKLIIPPKPLDVFVNAVNKWLGSTPDAKTVGIDLAISATGNEVTLSAGSGTNFIQGTFEIDTPLEVPLKEHYLDLSYILKIPWKDEKVTFNFPEQISSNSKLSISHAGMSFKIPFKREINMQTTNRTSLNTLLQINSLYLTLFFINSTMKLKLQKQRVRKKLPLSISTKKI